MTKNTAWAFAGNTAYAACQWVVFVLLVKVLGAREAGTFAYATAVTGPIFVLTNVRLRNLLATGVETAGGFADYLTARTLTTMVAVVAALLVGAMMSPGLGSLSIIALIALSRACDAFSDICHGMFQRELDMRSAAIGLSMNGIVSVALVAVALVATRSLVGVTAAYAGGSAVALAAWDLPRTLQRRRSDAWSRHDGRSLRSWMESAVRLVVTALPLGISSALGSVQANIPRYAIRFSLGAASLAEFAAISYIPMIGHLIVNATSQAALPMLASDARTSDRRYRTRLLLLVCGTAVCGAATLLAAFSYGGLVLRLIYGSEYAAHSQVLFWLAAATVVTFASVFLGTGTTARQRFRSQLVISIASLTLVLACTPPLVRAFGLVGAAWALFAGATVEFSAYVFLTVRDLKSPAVVISTVAPNAVAGGVTP
jgi:O-antigen/teichoic acid export membrane protein